MADGISPAAQAAWERLQQAWGRPIGVTSGYRDPATNARVGGAKGSQHMHGNAFDVSAAGMSETDRLALAGAARDAGFNGFGFYDDSLHFDVGGSRAWGPSYHSDSIPGYARDWVGSNVGGAQSGGAPMGLLSVSTSGMPEQQPRTIGERIKSGWQDGSLMDSLALGFNSMRMNPDQGMADVIGRRQAQRDDMAKRNRTAEVLEQIAPAAAALVREGLMSVPEALAVYKDQNATALAEQASAALARGDYKTAYALSMQISPQAAGQAIAQQYGPRNSEITGNGMYTVDYTDGKPSIRVNPEVQAAELERIRAEQEARAQDRQPTTAMINAEEEDMSAIDTIDQMNADLGNVLDMFGRDPTTGEFNGALQIGPVGALTGAGGYIGLGTGAEETRLARQAFDRFTTRYINDSLQLNKGVQTEGDAQRAAAELGGAWSTEAAYAALVELAQINERARAMKVRSVSGRRDRYKLDPVEVPAAPPSAVAPGGKRFRIVTPPGGGNGQ